MKTTNLKITNKSGLKLAASLDAPATGKIRSFAVFAHCFTCSKELKAISNIDKALTDFGIAVLRFDMTGIGGSEGNFSDTNFSTQIDDFFSAASFLEDNYQPASLLIGHSLGGSVALFSALRMQSAKAIVTIASPAEPAYLSLKLSKTKERAVMHGSAVTTIGGVKFTFKPQFFADIESYDMKYVQKKLKIPYLIMHSNADTYSDFKNAAELFKNANQPKSIISLDDIDHLMLIKTDASYAGRLIGVWSEKYL